MPIKPDNLHRYPPDWPAIRARIATRAGHKCEQCGVRDRAWGYRDSLKHFHYVGKSQVIDMVKRGNEWVRPPIWLSPTVKIIEIVCTVAHLDHQPENRADDNLRYLCQRCHLMHDLRHHKETAYMTRREGKAIDMFEVHA